MKNRRESMKIRHTMLLLALLGISITVAAQTSRGTVSGIVTDSNGSVIVGATITLKNVETTLSRTTTSNADGFYRFDAVELGTYSATFSASGFGELTKTQGVISAGQTTTVDAQIQPAGQQVTVNVTAEAGALLQTEAPVRGGNISQ